MALLSKVLPSFPEVVRSSAGIPLEFSSSPSLLVGKRRDDRLCHLSSTTSSTTSNDQLFSTGSLHTPKRRAGQRWQIWNGGEEPRSKYRRANLCVQRRQIVPLPTHVDVNGKPKPLSSFLCQPAGMESMLNTKALQSYECLGGNVYRCMLPNMEVLNFQVAPVVDLSVIANDQECIVEMLSCKFQGSEAVESQNERFSAIMRNHLTWDTSSEDDLLEVNLELNISLEVYTLPFTLLPLSAVETPGTAIMQAMVDRLVPLFLDHLMEDYQKWAQLETDILEVKTGTAGNNIRKDMPEMEVLKPVSMYSDHD